MHVGFLGFVATAAQLIIFGFLWRSLSAMWSDRAIGKAMAFIY